MSCWATVSKSLNIKATPEEIIEAGTRLGFTLQNKAGTLVYFTNGMIFRRADVNSEWTVESRQGVALDEVQYKREIQRAKALSLAKANNYRVTIDEKQGGKLVVRMKIG